VRNSPIQSAQRNSCTLRNWSRSTGISGHDRRNTHLIICRNFQSFIVGVYGNVSGAANSPCDTVSHIANCQARTAQATPPIPRISIGDEDNNANHGQSPLPIVINTNQSMLSLQELASRWGRSVFLIALSDAVGLGPKYIKCAGAIRYTQFRKSKSTSLPDSCIYRNLEDCTMQSR